MSDQPQVLIIEADYYKDITDNMASGVITELDKAGVSYDRLTVPGAFEVPPVIAMDLSRDAGPQYSGYIALGCVIRGETDHYDHICRETSRSLMDLSVNWGAALGFGILTCETMDQAIVRSDPKQKNKGHEVASACLRLMELKQQFKADIK